MMRVGTAGMLASSDSSPLGLWWFSIDRWLLGALLALMAIGAVLVFAASPAVAERIGLDDWHFVRRQLFLMPAALVLMIGLSLLTPRQARRLALLGFGVGFVLLLSTLVLGSDIKGARRWISILGFSLQPSELVKPFFAVLCAWLLARHQERPAFPGVLLSVGLLTSVVAVVALQPDIGMAVLMAAVWFVQMFLAGMSVYWVTAFMGCGLGALVGAYFVFPHVASRIDRFLYPETGDNYQVQRSLDAFAEGGLFGRGPGEGVVKQSLPDAHADFVFAVAGEELGLIACLLIVALFAFVVLRSFERARRDKSLFVTLAAVGLAVQFGIQALINMASTLRLMPTKGMTLPFISYGGSSLLAVAVGMGLLLALTRHRAGAGQGGR